MTGRGEILLVEDSPDHVELTMRILRHSDRGVPIQVASDGAAALEYLFARPEHEPPPVRLVILDLKLPRVNGHEVLRQIKSDAHTRGIPVVVLTSSEEEADLVRSYDLGSNSYVVNPLDFDQFSDAVTEIGQYWLALTKAPKQS